MGVYASVSGANSIPVALYQFTLSFGPTVAVRAGITSFTQIVLLPPLTGGCTLGAATANLRGQLSAESAVSVTLTPTGTVTVLRVAFTVPAVEVTVPLLA